MLFDSTNLFSDAQALTSTGAAASTNVIDLGGADTPKHAAKAISKDFGKGKKTDLFMQVVETFTSSGAATLVVELQTDTVEGFGSPTALWTSPAIALATLAAGYRFNIPVVPQGVERYLRVNYTVGTAAFTAGKVTAGLVFDVDETSV